jgi:hypothetical protein
VPGHRKCHGCAIFVQDEQWDAHQHSSSHRKRMRSQDEVDTMRATLRQAATDKGGVSVSQADGVDFGVVDISAAAQGIRTLLRVKTAPDSQDIKFIHAKILPSSALASSNSCVHAAFWPKSLINPFSGSAPLGYRHLPSLSPTLNSTSLSISTLSHPNSADTPSMLKFSSSKSLEGVNSLLFARSRLLWVTPKTIRS